MRFVFAIQLISCSVLLMFQPVTCYSCDKADWSSSLDGAGWSTCPKNNTYLKGLWRSAQQPEDERVGRIEFGKCCPANETSYFDRPAFCKNAEWDAILNGSVIMKMKIKQRYDRTLSRWNEDLRKKSSSVKFTINNGVHLIYFCCWTR